MYVSSKGFEQVKVRKQSGCNTRLVLAGCVCSAVNDVCLLDGGVSDFLMCVQVRQGPLSELFGQKYVEILNSRRKSESGLNISHFGEHCLGLSPP